MSILCKLVLVAYDCPFYSQAQQHKFANITNQKLIISAKFDILVKI